MLKQHAIRLVDQYHAADGRGFDAYWNDVSFHPMAEAKYLCALATLFESGVISELSFSTKAAAGCDRLEKAHLRIFGDGFAWGLNFPYQGLSEREPFLITTALVVEALGRVTRAENISEKALDLYESGMRALRHWSNHWLVSHRETDDCFPQYSEHIREPIVNAAAYAYGVLVKAPGSTERQVQEARQGLNNIAALRLPGIGWTYSPSSGIVDLIHQGYIINSFPPAEHDTITWCEELISLFDSGLGYLDVCTVMGRSRSAQSERELPILRSAGDVVIRVERRKARLWSLGELLVCVAAQMRHIQDEREMLRWKATANRVTQCILERLSDGEAESFYVRHSMHALHGVAELLSIYRENARTAMSQGPTTGV